MKLNISKSILLTLGLASATAFTGCIDETFPSNMATAEQVSSDPQAIATIVDAMSNYLVATATYGSSSTYYDAGIPSQMIARDAMCEDMPVSSTDYDWYAGFTRAQGLSAAWGVYPYYYWYSFIERINNVLKEADLETESEDLRHQYGILYGYRAMCYMDLVRMFEYRATGIASLDDKATADGIWGQTVPILEAREYTVADLVRNPRAPFQTMYRFMMTDLNRAEELIQGYVRPKVSLLDESVINGFKARMWLEMATRFNDFPEDLATQLAAEGTEDGYDDLGITSALECYQKAYAYAEKVINGGYTPLTSEQWHDPYTGFNTPDSNNSWVWGSYITNETEAPGRWYAFGGTMSSDCSWGWTSPEYAAFRCISSYLFEEISYSDWRKTSWVDPEDAGRPNNRGYYTMAGDNFTSIPEYGNLKFRVPDVDDYQKGKIASVPFMRVEEMYLIRAEAAYHTNGLGDAVSKLKDFVNTYRYTDNSYDVEATDYDSFIDALMIQKRIELWGEGLVYFDYKRLRLGIDRAYTGTNFLDNMKLKTARGYVAPWLNQYMPETIITTKDSNFKGNPNYSGVVTESASN